jgi:hypothetical protein
MKTIKYIVKKKFPVQVQYKNSIWNEEKQSNTNYLEKEFFMKELSLHLKNISIILLNYQIALQYSITNKRLG